jgi:hypothetical protein
MFDINEVIEEQYRLDGIEVNKVNSINKVNVITEEDICQEIFTSGISLVSQESLTPVWKSSLKEEEKLTLVTVEEDLSTVLSVKEEESEEELGLRVLSGIQFESISW